MPTEAEKLKAVIDTNVFVSGLNFPGRPREVLELLWQGCIDVYISPFIFEELERVLRDKFGWEESSLERILQIIREKAIQVELQERVSVIKEKDDDNRILECGFHGEVQYIVSGDRRHLLPLRQFRGIRILSPAEFLDFVWFST